MDVCWFAFSTCIPPPTDGYDDFAWGTYPTEYDAMRLHKRASPSPGKWPMIQVKLVCWEPAWGIPPIAKAMRKEPWHTQRCDQDAGNPLFPSIYPKTRVLYGELSPITISLREGVNLQLQLIKIPGHDKRVLAYELWRFSGLPDQARPATCDCLQPPNCERHGMF